MGLTYVTVSLKVRGGTNEYRANFLVDSGATDTLAPAAELRNIGVESVGKNAYAIGLMCAKYSLLLDSLLCVCC